MAVKTITWTDHGSYAVGTVTLAQNDTTDVQTGTGVKRAHWIAAAGSTQIEVVNAAASASYHLTSTGVSDIADGTDAGFVGEGYVPARWRLKNTGAASASVEIIVVHA